MFNLTYFKRSLSLAVLITQINVLNICSASAQTIEDNQQVATSRAPFCGKSRLSGLEFMGLVRDIISHGDLTDIQFIQNELNVKFTSQFNETSDGKPNPFSSTYETQRLFGDPLHIMLEVDTSERDQKKGYAIGSLRIESLALPVEDESFIADCLHISAPEFRIFFGGDFFFMPVEGVLSGAGGAATLGDDIQQNGSPGKDNSKIYLSFSYNREQNVVSGIEMHQNK